MRILDVRFKNLNSLVGEWRVDLSHPDFVADGIFAITGPTGAGKSTILDAICLALYGRTPRLSRVNQGGNEIMSRQTGECFAEVTFETPAGRFRCHWSQRRARKHSDGELQPPKHEIVDADTGVILHEKRRGVAEQIATTTGMDFDRFTRSMLLAQGGFAAFLQASPDERAPILEQITGMEIYSSISKRVHELRVVQKQRLEVLEGELEGIAVLGEDEESELRQFRDDAGRRVSELNAEIESIAAALTWLAGIEKLIGDIRALDAEQGALDSKVMEFAESQRTLELAEAALELDADFANLTSKRKRHEDETSKLASLQLAEPDAVAAAKTSAGEAERSRQRLRDEETVRDASARTITLVRTLDTQLVGKQEHVHSTRENLRRLEQERAGQEETQAGQSTQIAEKQAAREDVQHLLEQTQADERLVEQLAGIRERARAVADLGANLVGKRAELAAARTLESEADQQIETTTAAVATRQEELEGVSENLLDLQRSRAELLGEQSLSDWRVRREELLTRQRLTQDAAEATAQVVQASAQLGVGATREAELRADVESTQATRGALLTEQERLTAELAHLEERALLLSRIRDLTEHRMLLEDGTECPLCGSLDHPFARGNIPTVGDAEREVQAAQARCDAVARDLNQIEIALAGWETEMGLIADRRAEVVAKRETLWSRIMGWCADLDIPAPTKLTETNADGVEPSSGSAEAQLLEQLESLQTSVSTELMQVAATVKSAQAVEDKIDTSRDDVRAAEGKVSDAKGQLKEAGFRKTQAQAAVSREAGDVQTLGRRYRELLEALGQEIAPYGIEVLRGFNSGSVPAAGVATVPGIEASARGESSDVPQLQACLLAVETDLADRRDAWIARVKRISELDLEIRELTRDEKQSRGAIRALEVDLATWYEAFANLLEEVAGLREQRAVLLGDLDPDGEQLRVDAAVEAARLVAEGDEKTATRHAQELKLLQQSVSDLESSLAGQQDALASAEESFGQRLVQSSFADEAEYLDACIPGDERRVLADEAAGLEKEQASLNSLRQAAADLLDAQRALQLTSASADDLAGRIEVARADRKELEQRVGSVTSDLTRNDQAKDATREKSKTIEAQRSECGRWDDLHALIGSSDGKKYRNFAQGLTFDIMIGHANQQLRRMSDRYLLTHDQHHRLQLNVIDSYQAGEMRSTRNLSGGESFIVSLALALGLSQMASRNVRVDSLFLDEGFGTLDEESLDTALDALSTVHQEGKMIGIISHVPALKDRIGTQIVVTPTSSGRSKLTGPGCGRA